MIATKCCPDAFCWAENESNVDSIWFGKCYGEISVIAEEYNEDDYWWIHGCEGHENYFGKYINEEK